MSTRGDVTLRRMVWLLVGIIIGSLSGATYLHHTIPEANSSREVHYYGYVFNGLSADVSVIDRIALNVIFSRAHNVAPGHLKALLSPKLDHIYLVEDGGENIYLLDPSTFELKATIPAGKDLQHGAAFTTDGRYLLAVSRGEDALVLVDTNSNIAVAQVKVEERPHDVALSSDGTRAYVTNTASRSISVIDLAIRRVVDTIRLDALPHMIVQSQSRNHIYVGVDKPAGIVVLDSTKNTVLQTIPLKGDPHGLAATQDGRFLFAAIASEDSVSIIDLDSIRLVGEVQVGDHPHSIDLTPDKKYVYISNSGDGTVSIVNVQSMKVVSTVRVGSGPHNVLFYSPTGAVGITPNKGGSEPKNEIQSRNFTCGG